MKLGEIITQEFAMYYTIPRSIKNYAYEDEKIHKDRYKMRRWLSILMADRDVILFLKTENGEEMHIVTTKLDDTLGSREALPDKSTFPVYDIIIAGKPEKQIRHLAAYKIPSKEVITFSVDDVIKFIVRLDGLFQLEQEKIVGWDDENN